MAEPGVLRSIEIDLAANTLRLVLVAGGENAEIATETVPATLEVGTGGRLVGVELAARYIDVMPPEPGTEHLIRTATVKVAAEREEGSGALIALVLPRRGEGFEITWPSGNQ